MKHIKFIAFAAICCMMMPLSVGAATYLKELAVANGGSADEARNRLKDSGYTVVDYDLNRKAGGDFVYVGYKTTEDYTEAITDIVVQWNKDMQNLWLNGKYYVPSTCLNGFNGDCNKGAGGKDLFILYSKTGHNTAEQAVTSLAVNTNQGSSVPGYEGTTKREDKQDMNRGAGGDDIFLWMQKTSVSLPFTGDGSATNPFLIKNISDLEYFRNMVNNAINYNSMCAKLTADIDLNNKSWTPIGAFNSWGTQVVYTGTFDGDGHVIRNLSGGNTDNLHDMGLIGRAEGCTVKNLIIENANLKAIYRTGPLIGLIQNKDKQTTISNCATVGKLTQEQHSPYYGGTAGLAFNEGKLTISNSYTEYSNLEGEKVKSSNTKATTTNCYYGDNVKNKKESGELCYLLNGSQSATCTWFQELKKDAYPNLKKVDANIVHKTGVIYHNGKLSFGGDGSAETPFLLGNEEHLNTFKKFVNDGYTQLCAKLIADIDYTKYTTTDAMIGTGGYPYAGTFNGDGKNIKLAFNVNEQTTGLFRYTDGASIGNLTLSGTFTSSKNIVGCLIGSAKNTTLTHIINKVDFTSTFDGDAAIGGLVGQVTAGNLNISHCAFEGSLLGKNAHSSGGFLGWAYASTSVSLDHSFFAPTAVTIKSQASYTLLRAFATNNVSIDNHCYYTKELGTSQGEKITDEQLKSGEICYRLNDFSNENPTWLQTLGSDMVPTLWDAQRVYKYGDTYCNYYNKLSGSGTQADPYIIDTPQDLEYFRDLVNEEHPYICAKLTSDIDMKDRNWIPIGRKTKDANIMYKGVFDGDGYVIHNLASVSTDDEDLGLIGRSDEGCVVKNLLIHNIHLEGLHRIAPIVGYVNAATNIIDCGVYGVVKLTVLDSSVSSKGSGGLVGWNHNGGIVKNSFTVYDNINIYNTVTQENCFYGTNVKDWSATGELCYKLNGSTGTYHHWLQTIGTQAYPLQRTGKKVDKDGNTYKNIEFTEKDNTVFSGNMSSSYFRIIHHGGSLYEFVATLGIKDGQGEHRFPNMDIYYKENGSWIKIINLKNINRENVPFSQDWSGEITTLSGEFIDAHTWEQQPPVFWMMQGNHTSRKEASLLWKAPKDLKVLPTEFKIQSADTGLGLQVTGVRKTTAETTDGNAMIVDPYINATGSEAGSAATVITVVNPIYSLGIWDATDNKFISTQEIPDGAQNVNISLPQQDCTHQITFLMYAQKTTLSGTATDTTYVTSASTLNVKPLHAIRRTNITADYNNSNQLRWAIAFPKDSDLIATDQFTISRAYKSDYSDLTILDSKNLTDYDKDATTTESDTLMGWFSYKDTSVDGRSTSEKFDDTKSAFDEWTLSQSAKDSLTRYKYPARYIFYQVQRTATNAVWSKSPLYYKRWKALLTNVLPRVDEIRVTKTAQWQTTHEVKLRLLLRNPYPYQVVATKDQDAVKTESERQGFIGRMFTWDEEASIKIHRYSPKGEWWENQDEVAKDIIVAGSEVKMDSVTGNYYVEVSDVQAAPYTHYYYEASVDASASNFPTCQNMLGSVHTSDAEADSCYSTSLATITNFVATRGEKPGQVNLTWTADDMPNNTFSLRQETYKCAYDDSLRTDTLRQGALAINGCSGVDTEALAGMINTYVVSAYTTLRGKTYESMATAYGYSLYRAGKISGHVRMPNGTAMPGDVYVTIRLVSPKKLHLSEVFTPNKELIHPGYDRDSTVIRVKADASGYYSVDSLCFYGTGMQYEVSASCGSATFVGPSGTSPIATLTLEDANYEYSNIDFVCNDTHQFSGRILYEGSTVPVNGMEFEVNGIRVVDTDGKPITTDAMGNFALTLPKYQLNLRAYKEGHKLLKGGWLFGSETEREVPTQDYDGLTLTDSTKVRLVGRIVGGDVEGAKSVGFGCSANNLGDSIRIVLQLEGNNTSYIYYNLKNPEEKSKEVTFTQKVTRSTTSQVLGTDEAIPTNVSFQSKRIVIAADNKTGEFCLDLVPARYKIAQMYAEGYSTLYNVGEGNIVLDLTDSIKATERKTQDAQGIYRQTSYCAAFNRIYHTPVKLSVTQKGEKIFGEENVTENILSGTQTFPTAWTDSQGDAQYAFGYPVFKSGKDYNFAAQAYEEYRYNNSTTGKLTQVPIGKRKLTITNGLSTTATKIETTLNGSGYMEFTVRPDNTTFSFTDEKALMTLQAAVDVDGYSYESEPIKGYVMGERTVGVEVEAAVTSTPQILDIIRDPYGANSYAYREEGTQYTWTQHYEKNIVENFTFDIDLGVAFLSTFGFGVTTGTEYDWTIASINLEQVTRNEFEQKDGEYQLTLKDRICTSSDVHDVGAMADIYLGNMSTIDVIRGQKFGIIDSTTYAASADAIKTGAIKVIKQGKNPNGKLEYLVIADAIGAAPGKERVFAYTQKYILGTLIPNLERHRSLVTGKDSIAKYTTQIEGWQNIIKKNEATKVAAMEEKKSSALQAYSISGTTIEHSEEASSYYRTATVNGDKVFTIQAGSKESPTNNAPEGNENNEFKGAGFFFSLGLGGGRTATVSNSVRNYKTSIAGSGYVLSTTDNSYIDMDVVMMKDSTLGKVDKEFYNNMVNYEDGKGVNSYTYKSGSNSTDLKNALTANEYYVNNYVFIQRGGASRNPWSDADSTFFYKDSSNKRYALGARSLRIDNPKIYVENPIVNNQPQDEAAVFTIRLANETEINDKTQYLNPSTLYLSVDETTNPDGAQLTIDGMPLRNGMQFYLNPGESAVKTLEVRRGGKPYNYDNIKLQFTDNPDLWKLVDEATISVHYVPASSPVNLSQPANNWLMNTLSQMDDKGRYYIPVQIDGFSTTQYDNFDHIELQYKKQTESEDQWVNLCSYYADDSLYNLATGTKEMITTAGKISNIRFYGEQDPVEMKYDLRAVSFCRLGTGYVTRYSSVVSGTKDTRCPEVFGKPKPANGILTYSDVISLPFNEPIAYNYLDETANFSVQGYTNTSDADHSAYIYFPGSAQQSATTGMEVTLSKTDFTIEMMVKADATLRDSAVFISITDKNMKSSQPYQALVFGYLPKESCLYARLGSTEYKSQRLDPNTISLTKAMTHVALTHDAAEQIVHFFVGEQEIAKTEQTAQQKCDCSAYGPLSLGMNYKGAMSDIRLWSRVLSNYEISTKYKKVISPSERGLVCNWPMDEAAGDIIEDEVHGLQIKLTDVSWQTPVGYSVRLDKKPLELTKKAALKFTRGNTEDYTLSFWFKCDGSADNSNAKLFSAGGNNLQEKGMDKMRIGFYNKNLMLVSEGDTISFGATLDNLNATWHHVAVSVNHALNVASLFVDGLMTNEFNAESIGGIAGSYVAFGDNTFSGNIDNVSQWSMAIPASYINQYYNIDYTGREAELLINMNFEQTLTDELGTPYTAFSEMNNVIVAATGKIAGDTLFIATESMKDKSIHAPIRKGAELQNLPFSWTSTDNELQINIDKTDASINNQQINLVVRNVEDLNGNPMANAQMWSVYVNRNVLKWTNEYKIITLEYGKGDTFLLNWENTSGRVISYTIDNNAAWLQLADTKGTMQPLSSDYTLVTIAEGLAPGYYTTYLSLIDENNLISKLPIILYVNAKEPEWNVPSESEYKETMNIIATVKQQIDNGSWVLDTSPYDVVAAFIDKKCMGKTYLKVDVETNTSYAYLTVYGNTNLNGKEIEFRLWSDHKGKIYQLKTDSTIHFKSKAILGTTQPVEMRTSTFKYQSIELKEGWNWISLNVIPTSTIGVNNLLYDTSGLTPGDIIKRTGDAFSVLESNGLWDNTLAGMQLKPSNVYQLYAHKACTVLASGSAFTKANRQVEMNFQGEKWVDLAYLNESSQPIDKALTDFIAGGTKAPAGTVIKGHEAFAVATNSGHWIGSLEYLKPGEGYYVKRCAKDTLVTTIKYTQSSLASTAASENTDEADSFSTTLNPSNLAHATSMPIIATFAEGEYAEGDILLAIANGEVVGTAERMVSESASPELVEGRFFLTANAEQGATLQFAKVRDGEIVAVSTKGITYNADLVAGTLEHPYVIDFTVTDEGDIYDLSGIKHLSTKTLNQRGIYIQNGKKISK